MILAAIGAFKYMQANWRVAAIAAALASTFVAGYAVRGYICEADNNAAIVAENKDKADKEVKGNERLSEIEKRNTKVRETTRRVASNLAKNRGVNGERVNCIVSIDGVRGVNAIRRSDDSSFNQ